MGSSTKTKSTSSIATEEGYNAQLKEVERLRKLAAANPSHAIPGRTAGNKYARELKAAEEQLSTMSGFISRSAEEKQALAAQGQGLTDLQRMIGIGPGDQDITAGVNAQRDFASMLEQYSKGGFLPGEQDIATARGTVNQLFAGQQTALQQQLDDQRKMAQRNAALSGRGINDPIFQNQLAQTQTRQQQLLESQMTSAAAEQAQNLPMQRLQFAEGLAQARLSLGNQAMQNRQLLLSMGNQLREQERNFRLSAANKSQTQVTQQNPGALGIMAGIAGGIGTLGSGAAAISKAGGLGKVFGLGGAGGGQQQPQGAGPQFTDLPELVNYGRQSPAQAMGPVAGGPQFSASDILSANAAPVPNFNQMFNQAVTNSTPQFATQGYNTSDLWNRMQDSNIASRRQAGGWATYNPTPSIYYSRGGK